MRLLIDSNGLQARHHLENKRRLSVFIAKLGIQGFSVEFSSKNSAANSSLMEFDVLIITTRPHKRAPFSRDEISRIHDFVCSGGGLLLMSNHGPDLVEEDASLAKCFDIDIDNTWFRNRSLSSPTNLTGELLNNGHPIISGKSVDSKVGAIVTNTCCSMHSEVSEPLALLSPDMIDKLSGSNPSSLQLFGVALDQAESPLSIGRGRIVVLADSGFIGSDSTFHPGPGLIGKGDNITFILNTIDWLCAVR